MVASYEIERRQVAIRNLGQSYALAQDKSGLTVPKEIEADTPEGERLRANLGALTAKVLEEEYFCIGIQLGARYDGSPIVATEGGQIPVSDPYTYTPTSHPGGRAPHHWLADGTALFDHFGKGFTLLRLGGSDAEVQPFLDAADTMNVPIVFLEQPDPIIHKSYETDLVLIRPDQYVAWRGNRLPDDTVALLKLTTGANNAQL